MCGASVVNFNVFSVLCLLCLCVRLFIRALWSPDGKGLTSWLLFVVYNASATFLESLWASLLSTQVIWLRKKGIYTLIEAWDMQDIKALYVTYAHQNLTVHVFGRGLGIVKVHHYFGSVIPLIL